MWYFQIIIIIIIIIISFMQSIYTYIPETNYVPREYSVAAILLLLFMVLTSLVSVLNLFYFYISTFRIMCALPNMAVSWSFLTSCFPGMLITYFLNDFEIVPVAPIITGITFWFYIPHALYFYCKVFIIIIIIIYVFVVGESVCDLNLLWRCQIPELTWGLWRRNSMTLSWTLIF